MNREACLKHFCFIPKYNGCLKAKWKSTYKIVTLQAKLGFFHEIPFLLKRITNWLLTFSWKQIKKNSLQEKWQYLLLRENLSFQVKINIFENLYPPLSPWQLSKVSTFKITHQHLEVQWMDIFKIYIFFIWPKHNVTESYKGKRSIHRSMNLNVISMKTSLYDFRFHIVKNL